VLGRRRSGKHEPSAELAFVFSCLGWPRTADRSACARSIASRALRWQLVLELAQRHRVVGLVYFAATEAGVDIPEPVGAEFRALAQQVTFHELEVVAELSRLQGRFKPLGLEAVVLKGVSAALFGYGRIGLRQNRDIDLLVPLEHVGAGCAALTVAGYEWAEPSSSLDERALISWTRNHKDIVFFNPANGMIVELHWRLFDNPHLAVSEETRTLKLPTGVCFKALSAPASILYMSGHGAQHAWSRLKWLADLGAMINGISAEQLEAIYQQARVTGLTQAVGQAFILLDELLGTRIPATLLVQARSSRRTRLLADIARRAIESLSAMEIEDQAFGSTRKSLSHYLLSSNYRYLWSEMTFDFADVPGPRTLSRWRILGPFVKLPMWILHRLRLGRPG
jgi:hypothetical protein